MRLPKSLFFVLLAFSVHAQDTLPKLSLKLFEVNERMTIGNSEYKYQLDWISTFTKHKSFVSGDFTKGYSDTVRLKRFHEWFGPSSLLEIGLGSSFKFLNTPSRFLKRLRPHAGLYLSQQSFEFGIGKETRTKVDSFTFANPAYPAQAIDSVSRGEIFYNYSSKQAYVEAGALFDAILNPHFSLYAGFVYGFGIGYENAFSVKRREWYEIERLDDQSGPSGEDVNQSFNEPVTTSSRFQAVVGMCNRFTIKRKYAMGFLLEARFGNEFYKIKNENTLRIPINALNVGLRFYFRYFK